MSLQEIDVKKKLSAIYLGVQGENDAEGVSFDISSWIEEYGTGTACIYHQRQGDSIPYSKDLTISSGKAEWLFDDADTAKKGEGVAQLIFTVGDVVKKSEVFVTTTDRSVGDAGGDTPDPYVDFFERAEAILADAQTAATAAGTAAEGAGSSATAAQSAQSAAAGSATAAAGSATEAAGSAASAAASAASVLDEASDSESWAVGKRGGVDVGPSDPAYHNNSKYHAEQAASERASAEAAKTAAQSAQSAAASSQSAAAGSASAAAGSATEAASKASDAAGSATAAAGSATESAGSASSAASSETSALGSSQDSEAWAVGKRNGTDVESADPAYHNNSKHYSEQAGDEAENAEAYARGTRAGTDVESTDPTYHNNSKYYSEQAAEVAAAIGRFVFIGEDGDLYYHKED